MTNSKLIYSTDQGVSLKNETDISPIVDPSQQQVRLHLDRKGGGKVVSIVRGLQETVDLKTKKNTKLRVEGRHDPCVVPRAPPVVDSIVSLVIADQALQGGFIKPVI